MEKNFKKRSKSLMPKIMLRRSRVITLQEAIEKYLNIRKLTI